MDLAGALAYLDDHVNLETATEAPAAARRLESVRRLVEVMGDPQRTYPVLHLTGTNGKGSTAAMLTSLLVARGLSVGTYTSPHLERFNERIAWNGDPISNDAFTEVIESVALSEVLLDERPTVFDILTAGAFRWFADVAVDAAVVEVGLGGRWDATNVADGQVALVTNVSLDHAEVIGPTLADIASEKAGIVKPGSTLVLGETGDPLAPIFRDAGAAAVWERGRDFDCDANVMGVGGRVLELRTPGAHYDDVFVPLHGAHQGDNAALALAGAEAFFDAPLDRDVVTEAFAAVISPGRMEVAGREPLRILDGAHNPAGAEALARSLAEEFGTDMGRVLVVGFLRGRDPVEMLSALDASLARLVVACTPPSPRALPAADVAGAARSMGLDAFTAGSVAEGLARALDAVEPAEMMLVTGSLYVVGAARALLVPARHR
ncbi:MAG: bifunctional folylpolyglutamate synthase/dihydrofolate synthase [Actinobacteria bacterium]|nr:MAG: bifunctional folylpolyglutamate synthase/dihydrofolate synthase [Actinomycetota bacterium]